MNVAARFRTVAVALLLVLGFTGERGVAAVSSGTKISNQATASYQSASGLALRSSSNVVSVVVATLSSLTLDSKNAACSLSANTISVGASFTKTFLITNTSNADESFQISNASASAGSISSMTFEYAGGASSPASVNGNSSNPLSIGGSLSVVVTVNSTGVPVNTKIFVDVRVKTTDASANGSVSASAQQCAVVTIPPTLNGLGGVNTPITKMINGVVFIQSLHGATIVYDVFFKNSGGSPALNVYLDDPLPAGITPIMATVSVNGSLVSGSKITGSDLKIPVGNLAVGASADVRFSALVGAGVADGSSIINVATVKSDEILPSPSRPAALMVGVGNLVFDGDVGSSAPIGGAVVTLVDASGNRVPLTGIPSLSNLSQKDPMTTGPDGRYGFGLAVSGDVTYFVTVSAPGYVSRRLQIHLVPDPTKSFYSVTMSALDGFPLASAGGFDIVAGPISLANVYGLFGNIPLFRPSALTVTKTVDRSSASGGDRLGYTVTVANVAASLGMTTVTDDLPDFVAYAPGTARVDGFPGEPTVFRNELMWKFSTLDRVHIITFDAVILPNVSDATTLINHVVAKAFRVGPSGFSSTARAEAQTVVVPGVFTNRFPITGRVYLDRPQVGHFIRGDVGLPNVRVWLEDGESVVTDGFGRYNFPAVRPGMHVLHVDSLTLPAYAIPYDTRAYNDEKSIVRLVHGIFDGSLLQDVNFATQVRPGAVTPVMDVVPKAGQL